jgi:hypothetical protein
MILGGISSSMSQADLGPLKIFQGIRAQPGDQVDWMAGATRFYDEIGVQPQNITPNGWPT